MSKVKKYKLRAIEILSSLPDELDEECMETLEDCVLDLMKIGLRCETHETEESEEPEESEDNNLRLVFLSQSDNEPELVVEKLFQQPILEVNLPSQD